MITGDDAEFSDLSFTQCRHTICDLGIDAGVSNGMPPPMSPKGSTVSELPATSVKSAFGMRPPSAGKGSPTASTQVEYPKSPSQSRELKVSDFMGEPGFEAPTFGGPSTAGGKPTGDSGTGAPAFGAPTAAVGKPANDLGFGGAQVSGGPKTLAQKSPEDTGFEASAFRGPKAAVGKPAEPASPLLGGDSNKRNLNKVVQASHPMVRHPPIPPLSWKWSVHATG